VRHCFKKEKKRRKKCLRVHPIGFQPLNLLLNIAELEIIPFKRTADRVQQP
jgi:hypothetical protein